MNTSATQWHRRPARFAGPCPVCGCPEKHRGEHRAVAEDEGIAANWMLRHKTADGWKYVAVNTRTDKRRGRHVGPRNETLDKIRKAAHALAFGASEEDAAKAAGGTISDLKYWRYHHCDSWKFAFDAEMRKVVELVRTQAGTDAILEDPDGFWHSAKGAEKWLNKRSEVLFPVGEKPTLQSFYHSYFRPNCLGSAALETLRSYDQVVRQWAALTGDPPLTEISNSVMARFRDCLARMRGLKRGSKRSANSIRHILRHVQTILDKAGPCGPRNRDAAELIPKAPYVKPPREEFKIPKVVPMDHLVTVYRATAAADVPWLPGIKPPAWWRALLVVALYTGFRRRTLFSLKMTDVRWDDQCIVIAPRQLKCGPGKLVPLPKVALEHLLAIRTDRELLFPWGGADRQIVPWTRTAERVFHVRFRALQTAAGLAPEDHFGLHGIRRTHATLMWSLSPAAAQLSLGHSTAETTTRHYVNGMGIVRQAVEGLPSPDAFTEFLTR